MRLVMFSALEQLCFPFLLKILQWWLVEVLFEFSEVFVVYRLLEKKNFIILILFRFGQLVLCYFLLITRAIYKRTDERLEANHEFWEILMDSIAKIFKFWDVAFYSIVFLHASKTIINFVKWPNIEVLNTASKLTFFIEEIDRNTSYCKMRILLEE